MIRDIVKEHSITVTYLPFEDMTTYTLTKPLGPTLFNIYQARLLNIFPPKLSSFDYIIITNNAHYRNSYAGIIYHFIVLLLSYQI